MADAATPSAAVMSTMGASDDTQVVSNTPVTLTARPERPDEAAFKAAEVKKRKDLTDAQSKTKELEAKYNASKPSNKDSPNAQRQAVLKSELATIRSKQSANKSSRSSVQERLQVLDSQLKVKIQEQKTARSRIPFKSTEEIDQRVAALTKEVDSGRMKIVDEKKSLNEISSLNRQKKDFAGFDAKQKEIDALKQKMADTKKELDKPEMKALSAEYDQKQVELNALKAEQDAGYKSRDENKDAFFASKSKQNQIYQELKKLQDDYYKAKRTFSEYERESKRQYFAKKKAENEARDLERKKRAMDEELEAAKTPAYIDHIRACDSLIRILDPNSSISGKVSTVISQFAATAQRVVDDSGIKGTKLSKKGDDEESYFIGSSGKKSKKGKKTRGTTGVDQDGPATPKAVDVGLFYTPGVSEHFEKIGVKPPSNSEDQARVLKEVTDKKLYYEEHQDEKTKQNITEVQKKFESMAAAENGDTHNITVTDRVDKSLSKSDETHEISGALANSSIDDKLAQPTPNGATTISTDTD